MGKAIIYGGEWTNKKLGALASYLEAYLTVFTKQRHWVTLYYIDAFAGPGLWQAKKEEKAGRPLFDSVDQAETEEYKQGSPMIALGMPEPGFDRFVFVEKNKEYIANLKKQVREEYPEKFDKVQFEQNDANKVMRDLCKKWDPKARAVVFLDPFGMEVEWETIEAIAKTEAMDLWVLFPVGMGVNRMLTKDGQIPEVWQKKLDASFGTKDWFDRFYESSKQLRFNEIEGMNEEDRTKTASFEKIVELYVEQLKSVFPAEGIVEKPLFLYNSTNNPLFALCFAAGNPKGAGIAVNIAGHIIGKEE